MYDDIYNADPNTLLSSIPQEYITKHMIDTFEFTSAQQLLKVCPRGMLSSDLFYKLLMAGKCRLADIPRWYRTDKMIKSYTFTDCIEVLMSCPQQMMTSEIFEKIIERDPYEITKVPPMYKTQRMFETAIDIASRNKDSVLLTTIADEIQLWNCDSC